MTLTCPKCSASVSLPEEVVRMGGFLVQCSECSSPIPLTEDSANEATSVQVSLGLAAAVLNSPSTDSARSRGSGASHRSIRSGGEEVEEEGRDRATVGTSVMEMLGIDLDALEGPGPDQTDPADPVSATAAAAAAHEAEIAPPAPPAPPTPRTVPPAPSSPAASSVQGGRKVRGKLKKKDRRKSVRIPESAAAAPVESVAPSMAQAMRPESIESRDPAPDVAAPFASIETSVQTLTTLQVQTTEVLEAGEELVAEALEAAPIAESRFEAAAVEGAPVETAYLESAAVETADENASLATSAVDAPGVDSSPFEMASEPATLEAVSAEAAPVEGELAEVASGATGPVEAMVPGGPEATVRIDAVSLEEANAAYMHAARGSGETVTIGLETASVEPQAPAEGPPTGTLLEQWSIVEPAKDAGGADAGAEAPASGRLRQRYRIQLEGGGEMVRSTLDLIHLIKDGRLGPDDRISEEGRTSWRRASEQPELARCFEQRAADEASAHARPATPLCINHRAASLWRCGSCAEFFCADCVKSERIGGTQTVPCPLCSKLCRPIEGGVLAPSPWRSLPRLLSLPLIGWGPFYWVLSSMFFWMTFAGMPGASLLAFVLLVYGTLVVRQAASGRRELPTWPPLSQWKGVIARALVALTVVAIAAAPLVLTVRVVIPPLPEAGTGGVSAHGQPAGVAKGPAPAVAGTTSGNLPPVAGPLQDASAGADGPLGPEAPIAAGGPQDASPVTVARNPRPHASTAAAALPSAMERFWSAPLAAKGLLVLLALLAALYVPMGILIACVHGTPLRALDPFTVIRSIGRVPREYASMVGLCLLLSGAGVLLVGPFQTLPVLGGAGAALIETYILFVLLFVVGRMARQHAGALGSRVPE